LPYSQPDRLAVVWEDASYVGFPTNTPAPANYLDWQARNRVFTDMLATRFDTASLTGDGQPEQLSGKKVTPNFFDVLGVQPVVGRPFTVEEDKSRTPVVVLSYNLWRRRLGGDGSIIGRSILMNGVPTKVAGVMPKDFFFLDRKNSDYWVPMAFAPEQWARRQTHFLTVVARLRPGVTAEQAQRAWNALPRICRSSIRNRMPRWAPWLCRFKKNMREPPGTGCWCCKSHPYSCC
jgi:putative ABC transport system permease protein